MPSPDLKNLHAIYVVRKCGATDRFGLPRRLAVLIVLGFASLLMGVVGRAADLPVARLHSIFPPGARAGSAVDVVVAGEDLDDATRIRFSHEGITAILRRNSSGDVLPNEFTVTVAGDVPPGVYDARVVGRFGISNPRGFAIGDREEARAQGDNHQMGDAQLVALKTTVNGRARSQGASFFAFEAASRQRVLIECLARELDSRLDPVLVVFDAAGRELDRSRRGGLLDFAAPADGRYVIKLHDHLYRGGDDYFYRLTIGTGPRLDFVFPPAGEPGVTGEFQVFGRKLPRRTSGTHGKVDGRPLEMTPVMFGMPSSPGASGAVDGGLLVQPMAAAMDGVTYRMVGEDGVSNPVFVGRASAPVFIEAEPNDKPADAQRIPIPCEVAGRFHPANDVDWFTFKAAKGESCWITVYSQRLGLPTNPFVVVQKVTRDGDGNEKVADLKEIYDTDTNIGGREFNTATRDPSWKFEVPETGTYRIQVRDLFNRSQDNPALVYRLVLRKESPDFKLVVMAPAPPPADRERREVRVWTPFLRRGDSIPVRVMAIRQDGFNGGIALHAEGLPPGVELAPVTIPAGQNSTTAFLVGSDACEDWTGTLRVVGKARVGEQEIVREATGGTVTWTVQDFNNEPVVSRVTREVVMATAAEAIPITIEPAGPGPWETAIGGKVEIPLKITRRGEFEGGLKLRASGPGLPDPLKEWDVAAATNLTVLELDLSKTKIPAGFHQLHILARTQGKYRRLRPDEWKTTEAALKVAEDEHKKAEHAAAALHETAKGAQEAATAAGDGDSGSAEATKARDTARRVADDAVAQAREADAKKEEAARRVKQLSEKLKVQDVNAAIYSRPIDLRVASAPIVLNAEPAPGSYSSGASLEISVVLTRLYGFADGVDVSLKEGPGFKASKITILGGRNSGVLKLERTPDAKPGESRVVLQASLKFNGQDLTVEHSVLVRLSEMAQVAP